MKRTRTLITILISVILFQATAATAAGEPQKRPLDRIVTKDGLITVRRVEAALSEKLQAEVSSVEIFPGVAPRLGGLLWKPLHLKVDFVIRRNGVHVFTCQLSYSSVSVDALAFLARDCQSETADLSSFYLTRQSVLGISKD